MPPRFSQNEEMDIGRRLIGASGIYATPGKMTDVDLSGLVRRLLLFDQYVLVSVRLQEFPFLARYLGYEGLRDLLFARVIEIRMEALQLAEVGRSRLFGAEMLPLYHTRRCLLGHFDH